MQPCRGISCRVVWPSRDVADKCSPNIGRPSFHEDRCCVDRVLFHEAVLSSFSRPTRIRHKACVKKGGERKKKKKECAKSAPWILSPRKDLIGLDACARGNTVSQNLVRVVTSIFRPFEHSSCSNHSLPYTRIYRYIYTHTHLMIYILIQRFTKWQSWWQQIRNARRDVSIQFPLGGEIPIFPRAPIDTTICMEMFQGRKCWLREQRRRITQQGRMWREYPVSPTRMYNSC